MPHDGKGANINGTGWDGLGYRTVGLGKEMEFGSAYALFCVLRFLHILLGWLVGFGYYTWGGI
jgi:hypothetical protein